MPRAAIIGAGPAGCAAALRLARSGWAVTLVEQHRFPRDKVCGECLSPLAIEVLRRMGLIHAIESLGPARLTRSIWHAPGGASVAIHLPVEMVGLSRRVLDQMLLDADRQAGATVRQPARCERIDIGKKPRVSIRELEANRVDTIDADWVLLADGKSALLSQRPAMTGDFGINAHFERISGPRDAVELFALRGCYGGLAAIEANRWNAAFVVPRRRVDAHDGDIDALVEAMIDENATLRARLRNARQLSRWRAAPAPRFSVIDDWPQRVIPLGNAAAALEPIGGEGMGLAMRSAELTAGALIEAHTRGEEPNLRALRRDFVRLWRTRSLASRALAIAVSRPRITDWVVPLTSGGEPFVHDLMRLTGKCG